MRGWRKMLARMLDNGSGGAGVGFDALGVEVLQDVSV